MARLFTATLLLTLPLFTYGQIIPRRGMFSLIGSYSYSGTIRQPQVVVMNGPYQLHPGKVNSPECYDENGRLVACNGTGRQISLGVLYRLSNRSQTAGWMLYANASLQQQVFTLNYPDNRRFSIPVACTPSIRRLLRSTGASVSVGRFWDVQDGNAQVFVCMGVMAATRFQYLRGIYPINLPDPTPTRYLSGGSGTLIQMFDQVPQYNWLLTPEIGLTTNDFPFELAASVHLPILQPTVFSELHSFAENNRITGQNRVDYSNAVFNLTLRLGFNLSKKTRLAPTPHQPKIAYAPPPSVDPVPAHRMPAPDPPKSPPINSRFDRLNLKETTRLAVFFDLGRADLRPASFPELDELAQWLMRHPMVEIRLEGHTDLIGTRRKTCSYPFVGSMSFGIIWLTKALRPLESRRKGLAKPGRSTAIVHRPIIAPKIDGSKWLSKNGRTMKPTYFLLLFLFAKNVYGQNRYLFTLAELKKLASCPDKTCFRKLVTAKGYEFSKVEKSTIDGMLVSIHTYYMLNRTTQQPYYPEHLIAYVETGATGRSVHFLTKSVEFPALLDADITQEHYVLSGTDDPAQDRKYVQEGNGIRWMLDRKKPGFSSSRGVATYRVSLSGLSKSTESLTGPNVSQPTTNETASLGVDWDKNYTVRNAIELLKAERTYAADYERQHGKMGHTFSRCEKVRIQASYMGQYRTLTNERWSNTFELALRTTGFTETVATRAYLFRQEGLFRVGNELIWMPIQELVIPFLRKEVSAGRLLTLYAILVSHHNFGGTLHLSFLVNEFANSPGQINKTADTKQTKAAIATSAIVTSQMPTAAISI